MEIAKLLISLMRENFSKYIYIYVNPKKVLRREVSILNEIKELCSQIFGILAFIKKHVERSNSVTSIFCTDIKSTQNNSLYVFLDKGKDAENLRTEFFYFIIYICFSKIFPYTRVFKAFCKIKITGSILQTVSYNVYLESYLLDNGKYENPTLSNTYTILAWLWFLSLLPWFLPCWFDCLTSLSDPSILTSPSPYRHKGFSCYTVDK